MRLNSFASATDTYGRCLQYDDAYGRPSSTLFDLPPEATTVLHPHLEEEHPRRAGILLSPPHRMSESELTRCAHLPCVDLLQTLLPRPGSRARRRGVDPAVSNASIDGGGDAAARTAG